MTKMAMPGQVRRVNGFIAGWRKAQARPDLISLFQFARRTTFVSESWRAREVSAPIPKRSVNAATCRFQIGGLPVGATRFTSPTQSRANSPLFPIGRLLL